MNFDYLYINTIYSEYKKREKKNIKNRVEFGFWAIIKRITHTQKALFQPYNHIDWIKLTRPDNSDIVFIIISFSLSRTWMSAPPCLWIKTKYSVYSSFRQRGLFSLSVFFLSLLTCLSPSFPYKFPPTFSHFFIIFYSHSSVFSNQIQIRKHTHKTKQKPDPLFCVSPQKMMQRCGSYQCYSAGECSCNGYYGQQGTYFSLPTYNNYYETEHYSFESSSPVDCTLSLGTPSTRMTEYDEKRREEQHSASNFTWDLPRTKHPHSSKTTRRSSANSGSDKSNANNGDQMFARHCANCDTTTTPLWRNGPSGPKVI